MEFIIDLVELIVLPQVRLHGNIWRKPLAVDGFSLVDIFVWV